MAGIRIGVDIGGTFTDLVAVNEALGEYRILKVPSTPANYMLGIKNGVEKLFARERWSTADVDLFFHGTTVATNTVLERKGARTGLVCTAGFRDILEVGRTERPPLDLYNLQLDRLAPLVPRRLRLGVPERIAASGAVVEPLDEAATAATVRKLVDAGIESLSVALINSYANPDHERRVREIALAIRPDLYVCLSSEVNPQHKEYERTSTTVLSAYVGPRVSRYVASIEDMLQSVGVKATLHVMQASGGAMTADAVQENAIRTVLSGPAAGVIGAIRAAGLAEEGNFVGFDMGGTSTDVALVKDGNYRIVEETRDLGHHLRIPMIDIVTIGAGGGSIAAIDSGGALKVGPQSAGADPGPACYGRGDFATVTDANVVLGFIAPEFFLGGEIRLDADRARRAIEVSVARPLGISVEDAAQGVLRIANANMIRAIKRVSIERGHDVRDFSLVPFGGAGALHAWQLARELGMRRVIVPIHPGLLSACGLVESTLEYQFSKTILRRLGDIDGAALEANFAELEQRGREQMIRSGSGTAGIEHRRAINLRYRRQIKQCTIEMGSEMPGITEIQQRFYAEHRRLYGYATEEPIDVVDLRVGTMRNLGAPVAWGRGQRAAGDARKGTRRAHFAEIGGFVECPVYARERLDGSAIVQGPAIVEQLETNVVVGPGQVLTVHRSGALLVKEVESGNA